MEGFVGAVLIEIGKYLVEPIKRQCKYLCCFNTNVLNLEDEATKLGNAKVGVDGQVETARSNAEVILPTVETWLHNVSTIQEERSGIETEIRDVKGGCLAIKTRFLLGRKATKMAEAMKVLLDDGSKFERIANPAPPAAKAPIPDGQFYEFGSRKQIEDNIMEALREKKVGMMGIWGMGGVGKTTMAEKIMRRARGENLFVEIVMVVVSQPVDTFKIQQQMAELLGLKLEEETVPGRAHKLRTRLMSTKSILIILDDLWKELNLKDLGISDQRELKECMILLTSRNTDVFSAMSAEKTFQMKILEDVEAWSLFEEKVGAYVNDPTILLIAQEIVRECNGLPIAVIAVGVALKDKKNEASWKNAQRELKSGYSHGISEFLAKVYNPLKLSYDLLDDELGKSMFLLCCLFPEDYDISLSDLSLYAWGLGMFEGITCLQDARDKMHATIETLKSRSLLLDGQNEAFTKMHDVVRDVGILIAKEKKRIDHSWICSIQQLPIEKTTLPKIMLPGGSGFPNLRLLFISKTVEGWKELPLCDNIFERASELRVLAIEGYILRPLPNTIQLLGNLRTLSLESCISLEDISIVGKLASLEILICHDLSKIKELPVDIGSLSQLKLLHIEKCMNLKTIVAGVISRLIGLEELTLIGSFKGWEWGASEGKSARLCELNSLSSLTTLRIEIEDASLAAEQIHLPDLVEFDVSIGNWGYRDATSYGKQMRLSLGREVFIEGWIHQLLRTTESLHLLGEGSSNLVPHLPGFQSLKKLVFGNVEMTRLIDGRSRGATTVFPLLESLSLNRINNLEEIQNGLISSDSFKNLQKIRLTLLPKLQHLWDKVPLFCNLSSIEIVNCDRLRSLFPWTTGNDHLPRLKNIEIVGCSMLEQIMVWGEEVNVGTSSPNQSCITFPELEKLDLRDLPRLTSFCKGIQSIEFPLLTKMTIMKCPNLKSLVSSTDDDSSHLFCKSGQAAFGSVSFTRLGYLCLKDCDEIKSLFSFSIASNLVNLRERHICGEMVNVMEDKVDEVERCPFNNLEKLTLINLPKLKAFCNWRCAPELPSLRQLYIYECPLMERLSFLSITSPISSYSFENLQSIEIINCSMLEQVVLWNEEENGQDMNGRRITFPKLERLHLHVLPRLTSFCKGIQSIQFPRLIGMKIKKCPNLESLKVSFGGPEHLVLDGYENKKSLFSPSTAENLKRDLTNERVSLWCDQMLMDFFTRLVKLKVLNCGNIKNLFSPSIAGNLVNLKHLTVERCGEMVKVIEDEEEVEMSPFIKLEVLKLIDLPKLKAFWRCALQLPSLRKVLIEKCPQMEILSSPNSSDSFENLESLSIRECSMLEQVVLWKEEENGKEDIEGQSSRITFRKLEELSLHDLPRLTSFCKGIQSIEFPLLIEMVIVKCPNLKSLVVSSKENDKRCPGAINYDSLLHLFCKSQAAFGRLDELVIKGYESKRSVSLCCDQIPDDFFTGLSVLRVNDCGNIKSLFSPSIAGNLVNLRELSIVSCREMVKVIEDEEVEMSPFVKLEVLTMKELPKLKAFCDWICALHLPSLKKVSIAECREMERFSFGSLTTPSLEKIDIDCENISVYTKDLNDALFWDRISLHLDILFGTDH